VGKPRKLTPKELAVVLKPISNLALGATCVHPGVFPTELGIGQRTRPRNTYAGYVVTHPAEDTYVFGLTYHDAIDDGDNEDMYRLDTATGEVRHYKPHHFEREFPEYAGYHRAEKFFLR
jgi:hypothetical protein